MKKLLILIVVSLFLSNVSAFATTNPTIASVIKNLTNKVFSHKKVCVPVGMAGGVKCT